MMFAIFVRGMLKARRNRFTNTGVFDRGSVPKYGQYLSPELPRIAISYAHNFQRKFTTPCEGEKQRTHSHHRHTHTHTHTVIIIIIGNIITITAIITPGLFRLLFVPCVGMDPLFRLLFVP